MFININTLLLPIVIQKLPGLHKIIEATPLSVTVCLKKVSKKASKVYANTYYSLFPFCLTKRAAFQVKPCSSPDI